MTNIFVSKDERREKKLKTLPPINFVTLTIAVCCFKFFAYHIIDEEKWWKIIKRGSR